MWAIGIGIDAYWRNGFERPTPWWRGHGPLNLAYRFVRPAMSGFDRGQLEALLQNLHLLLVSASTSHAHLLHLHPLQEPIHLLVILGFLA